MKLRKHDKMRRRIGKIVREILSERTFNLLSFDILRFRTRLRCKRLRNMEPPSLKLHLGCGKRLVAGWLNVDVTGSDFDVDLARPPLPWRDSCLEAIVSQQVIEHLDLRLELIPLLTDLYRLMAPGGEIWLSCPDMEKVCRGYLEDKGRTLYEDASLRGGITLPAGMPVQHYINDIFHQDGCHRNLFDFALLSWAVAQAGFSSCRRVVEADLLERFPDLPPRNDDVQALYVTAKKFHKIT